MMVGCWYWWSFQTKQNIIKYFYSKGYNMSNFNGSYLCCATGWYNINLAFNYFYLLYEVNYVPDGCLYCIGNLNSVAFYYTDAKCVDKVGSARVDFEKEGQLLIRLVYLSLSSLILLR